MARLHSENKIYGGQSGMVWSVRILDIIPLAFFLFLDCIMVPVPSSSFEREGGMGGDTTHVLTRLLLVTRAFNLSISLFARALPRIE